MSPKSQRTAGRLGMWLGGLGAHNFYLGKTRRGLAQLLIPVFEITLIVIGQFYNLPGLVAAATSMGIITIGVWIWGCTEGYKISKAQPGSKWRLDGAGLELA